MPESEITRHLSVVERLATDHLQQDPERLHAVLVEMLDDPTVDQSQVAGFVKPLLERSETYGLSLFAKGFTHKRPAVVAEFAKMWHHVAVVDAHAAGGALYDLARLSDEERIDLELHQALGRGILKHGHDVVAAAVERSGRDAQPSRNVTPEQAADVNVVRRAARARVERAFAVCAERYPDPE